ncbi:MAG: DNA-binding response regulator [Acidimicrobiales bacterium]|nr:MAG: DNA-binding response regulator [Acidimicrobiales bacterium]
MSERARVLIVEDEESYVEALRHGLSREGFEVVVARDGVEALELFDRADPDLVLLDLMLPGLGGVDVCREIRTRSDVPIVMVTAKGEEIDAVVGLEVGADDYVTKPFRFRELVARIRAVLRRQRRGSPPPSDGGRLEVGDVLLDLERHEVKVRGRLVPMPLKEFQLLELLMRNAGRVVSREVIIDRVWGHDYVGDTKTLDVHVKRLRGRIEEDPSDPKMIVTVRGVGYRFERG